MLDDALPVVDLRDHLAGTPAQHRRAAGEVADACSRIGFFLLRQHGMDPAMLARTRVVSAAFFEAPEEHKRLYHHHDTSRGYTPMGAEALGATLDGAAGTPPDLKEAFAIGAMDLPERAAEFADTSLQPVTWPNRPPTFRRTWLACHRALRTLAGQVMSMFADALDVHPAYFTSRLDHSTDFLRVINYPQQSTPPRPGALRAGAHTDFGVLTIVAADNTPGGLQVRLRDQRWIDVPALPDTLIVNIGDLMAHWTNHRWVSALHRVANPPRQASGPTRRQSIVFFHNPDLDTVIEPLPTCRASTEAAMPPVIAGQWLRSKALRQRAGTRDEQ